MPDDTARGGVLPRSIYTWRFDKLVEAGYPQEEAYLLAKDMGIDTQVAIDLLKQGCPVDTAIRILT